MSNGSFRARRCVYTFHIDGEPTPELWDAMSNNTLPGEVRYHLFGLEHCPTTGNPHIQGYAEFFSAFGIKRIQQLLSIPNAHVEVARGTYEENFKYCTKEQKFIELGTSAETTQGTRTDLQQLADAVREHASDIDLVESGILNVSNLRALGFVRSAFTPNRDWPMNIHWFHGPSGSGKTRTAFALAKQAQTYYWKESSHHQWWDGYSGQHTVIIDELRPGVFPFSYLLQLLDRYPFRVQTKGSTVTFTSHDIVITSPFTPQQFAQSSTHEEALQLLRRVTQCTYLAPPAEGAEE